MLRHLPGVARHQEILARAEQALAVRPGRADQRDAAGQGLEDADRRDARQRLDIGPARHVHRHAEAAEDLGDAVVGQPAGEVRPGLADPRQGLVRVADAVDPRPQAEAADRLQQKMLQLDAALAVAPVADPDQVAVQDGRRLGRRPEQRHIGGLVPGPDAPAPAARKVDLADRLAEGQHAVIAVELEAGDLAVAGQGAVVGVVEQQAIAAAAQPMPADRRHQRRLVPLVHDDEVGPREAGVEVERRRVVGGGAQAREGGGEGRLGVEPCLGLQVAPAPAVQRLEHLDGMAAGLQLADDAAQEMGVAVVPAGNQGVDEEDDAHGNRPARRCRKQKRHAAR